MSEKRPDTIIWMKCQCGSPACNRMHPTNIGWFYQGTGFEPHEVEWLNAAWNALSDLESHHEEAASDKS